MSYRHGAQNMCDSGISDTIETITESVQKLVKEVFTENDFDDVPELVTDDDGKETVQKWLGIPNAVAEHIVDNLEEALESVVEDVDNHMQTVKDEAHSEGFESGMESASEDMVPYEDFSEKEEECTELEQKVDELEASKNQITINGEEFRWIPGGNLFVSELGTTLKLVPEETEMPSICTVW